MRGCRNCAKLAEVIEKLTEQHSAQLNALLHQIGAPVIPTSFPDRPKRPEYDYLYDDEGLEFVREPKPEE